METEPKSPAAKFLWRRDIWIRYVCEANITLVARVVGVHLAMRMGYKKQYAWPNIKTMAKSLSVSARHAQRGMHELEEAGLLTVDRVQGKGNYYTIRLLSDP